MVNCLYLYYRIKPGQGEAAAPLAHTVLAAIATHARHAALLRRADDAETWMEVYEDASDVPALLAARELAVSRSGLAELIVGGATHVEHFVPLETPTCA